MAPFKVLITEACGFIGHSAYLHLRAQPERYEVYALDRSRQLSDRVPADRVFDIPEERFFEVGCALKAHGWRLKALDGAAST